MNKILNKKIQIRKNNSLKSYETKRNKGYEYKMEQQRNKNAKRQKDKKTKKAL